MSATIHSKLKAFVYIYKALKILYQYASFVSVFKLAET
jgi:hypothetical protein